MPATISIWTRLAPATLRERKMRSGISGFGARGLADDEAGEQQRATRRRGRGCGPRPSRLSILTMV